MGGRITRLTLTLGRLDGGGRDRRPFSRGDCSSVDRQADASAGIHPSYASALDDRLLGLDMLMYTVVTPTGDQSTAFGRFAIAKQGQHTQTISGFFE